jgi:S1-C subfamily serine protease
VDGGQAAFVQGPATSGGSTDLSAGGPADPAASQVSSSVQPNRGGGQAGKPPLTDAQLLAACVRLKIADPTGNSYGSGTIIDVRNGEALVLTCGHLFRDSNGKGDISVDLFGPGEPRQVPGRLVGCDLEKDVGLVSIPAPVSVQEIRVAPPGYVLHVGDSVTTIGCSNGAPPTVQSSHVDSIGRFRGPPNFQVAGQPVQGRSGGGVVSADGLVIGVCNAADPEDNEGLYAALASIYKELDRAKLAFVYRPATSATASDAALPSVLLASAAQSSFSDSAAPIAAASSTAVDRDLPVMPATMPAITPPDGSAIALTSQNGKMAAGLTTDEAAALAELRQKARGAEVICIVRPLSDPHARSEIIVLDRASPEFLQKLAAERRCQTETRQLTSLEVPAASR